MTCDPPSIHCSIDELGQTLTSLSVSDLVTTGVPTILGVLVGSVVSIYLAKAAAKSAEQIRKDDHAAQEKIQSAEAAAQRALRDEEAAAQRTLRDEEAAERRIAQQEEIEERRNARLDEALDRLTWKIDGLALELRKLWERQQAGNPEAEWGPQDWSVLGAVASARMIATIDADKQILDALRGLVLDVRKRELPERVASLTGIWRILIIWREGYLLTEVLTEIERLATVPVEYDSPAQANDQ